MSANKEQRHVDLRKQNFRGKSRVVAVLVSSTEPKNQAFGTAERRGRQRHRGAGRRPTKRERASQTPLHRDQIGVWHKRLYTTISFVVGRFCETPISKAQPSDTDALQNSC